MLEVLGRPVRAVLFDNDGTLVDSDAAVERGWRRWAERYGVNADEAVARCHGATSEGLARELRPDLSEDEVRSAGLAQMELQYDDNHDVVATPGALELLTALDARGVPWAVFTHGDARLASERLAAAGIHPRVLVTIDDVDEGKPHPEGYLAAAEQLGVSASECLVVEDSAAGVQAGRAAGAVTAALKGEAGDVQLDSLADLLPLVT